MLVSLQAIHPFTRTATAGWSAHHFGGKPN
jgi:hypothetical protein